MPHRCDPEQCHESGTRHLADRPAFEEHDGEFGFEDQEVFGQAGYFSLLSLGYNFAQGLNMDDARIRVDYVYNVDEDIPLDDTNGTRDYDHVLTLVTQWEKNGWGLWTDLSAGRGIQQQSDVLGLALMPFYSFNKHHQAVLRYTYLTSREDNGIRLNRYEDEIVEEKGNRYNEFYAGYNLFFYGHKLKWQTGLQYTTMEDDADDGGAYNGWGLTTGLRMYWY